MKLFKEYLAEAGRLVRFDDRGRTPEPAEFAFSPDGSGSGRVTPEWTPPANWKRDTGLFAGTIGHAAPYAAPRKTRWITTGTREGNRKPTIWFQKGDRDSIKKHISTMSQYNRRQGFKETLGGEVFRSGQNAPKAIDTTDITNPLKFIKNHYRVRFIDNLDYKIKNLLKRGIHHGAEGDFKK